MACNDPFCTCCRRAYKEGFLDGHSKGFNQGFKSGYTAGYVDGFQDGSTYIVALLAKTQEQTDRILRSSYAPKRCKNSGSCLPGLGICWCR